MNYVQFYNIRTRFTLAPNVPDFSLDVKHFNIFGMSTNSEELLQSLYLIFVLIDEYVLILKDFSLSLKSNHKWQINSEK